MSKVYTAKDIQSKFRRQSSLNRRTPPPAPLTQDSYPGWSVDFEWRADQANGDCLREKYCTNSLSTLLSQCKGCVPSLSFDSSPSPTNWTQVTLLPMPTLVDKLKMDAERKLR